MRPGDFIDPDRILTYTYRSHDGSLLGPLIRRHICLKLLPLVPRGLSANLITMIGHIAIAVGFLWIVALRYGPLEGWESDGWPYLVPMLSLAMILITDDIDGLQARRLGISSPLGDFIDHWLDALAGFLVPLGAFVAYGADPFLVVVFIVFCGFAWWTGTAERWVTGELRLPPVSEVEMNVLMMVIHLVAAIAGPGVWHLTFFDVALIDGFVWFGIVVTPVLTIIAAYRGDNARQSLPGLAATLAPLIIWFASVRQVASPPVYAVLLPMIFGMAIAGHVGELLRRILIGTRERPYDWLAIGVGGILLVSLIVPAARTPAAIGLLAGLAGIALSVRLAFQFVQTLRYMMNRRGDALFATRAVASTQIVS